MKQQACERLLNEEAMFVRGCDGNSDGTGGDSPLTLYPLPQQKCITFITCSEVCSKKDLSKKRFDPSPIDSNDAFHVLTLTFQAWYTRVPEKIETYRNSNWIKSFSFPLHTITSLLGNLTPKSQPQTRKNGIAGT
ncbi:hypothetical protein CDAR_68281 [Caerostris darwini]|uniref:Uncharacterized protein n=1 Tax=Caerostris darwini TaxID=1538125 RepID=A0AAV4RR78_9ARAC|nr:hypothetical protein CDAR_68281 [Caerostris darwini]